MGICLVALVGVGILAVAMGAVDITIGEVVSILRAGPDAATDSPKGQIIWSIRLPRLLMGVLVGSALAVMVRLYKGFFVTHWPTRMYWVSHRAVLSELRLRSG